MANSKTISLKHNQMVKFISETIMELGAKRITEQNATYVRVVPAENAGAISPKYGGTKEEAENGWNNLDSSVKDALKKYEITNFAVIPHITYENLPSLVRTYLKGYLYPFKAKEGFFRNNALAEGQALYQYIAGIRHIEIDEVKICFNMLLDKKVNCETGIAYDGTRDIAGFEVDTDLLAVPSIFAYEGTERMNTKYFCRPYLSGDASIPDNVKPKVLMFLQQAWSNKTGKDLGVNKRDWNTGEKQTHQQLNKKLGSITDHEILTLVSDYIVRSTKSMESRYNAGTWQYIVGSENNKEESYPLSGEQHIRFFKDMKNFAAMLLKTNCGFGVGEQSLTNEEKELRKKYGDVFMFMKERPDNWDDMGPSEQDEWEEAHKSMENTRELTIEEEDEIQFWWDMVSVALVVVGLVLTATGIGTPVGVALIALSTGMGLASAGFDLYQGQTAWGVLGIGLEIIPFLKVFKMSTALKLFKGSDDKLAKILTYGLENGRTAMTKKFGKDGVLILAALKANKKEMLKLLGKNTTDSVAFLKRFSTMDAVEFYALRRFNKAFKEATQEIPWTEFNKGLNEMSTLLWNNTKAWKEFLGQMKYNLSVPFKMVLATLAGVTIKNTTECFDVELDINGKNVLMDTLAITTGTAPIVGLRTIKITLDPEQTYNNSFCTILAVLHHNIVGKDQNEKENLEELINQEIKGTVTISEDGTQITVIVDGADVELVSIQDDYITPIMDILSDFDESVYKARIEAYAEDEEILEFWLNQLGEGDYKIGEEKLQQLLTDFNSGDLDAFYGMFDLLEDADKVFINKEVTKK